MPARRILVLAGTRAGRELAAALLAEHHHVVTSLAGVTSDPILPQGMVRTGGFGDVEGLVNYLQKERFHLIADATHPFAVNMSRHAYAAANAVGISYIRLERQEWRPRPGDDWIIAQSAADAADQLPYGSTVLLTIGRKQVAPFFTRDDLKGVVRMIETPVQRPPSGWQLLISRPPFAKETEKELMVRSGITHLVAKNSGGDDGFAKLVAARECQVKVVVIKRPHKPDAACFSEVGELVRSLHNSLLP